MKTTNELLLDSFILHQIGLLRVNNRMTKEAIATLNVSEAEVRRELENRMELLIAGGDIPRHYRRRIHALEKAIRDIRKKAYTKIATDFRSEYMDILVEEVSYAAEAVERAIPVALALAIPSAPTLNQLLSKPFEGRTLSDWIKYMTERDVDRIISRAKIGIVQGQNSGDIIRGVLGTRKARGKDGLTQASRREITSITRTATNFFGNQARRELFKQNEDVIAYEQYVAILDTRTTIICMSLDGNRYAVGDGPYPPIHVNCRSFRVPVISDEIISRRPFKAANEKILLSEYASKNGIAIPRSRELLPRGHKGTYDKFSLARGKELIGTVPDRTTYKEFLQRQSKEFQEEVLGKRKALLFRQGNLPLERFVDTSGRNYSLSELAVRDRKAFVAAGLL